MGVMKNTMQEVLETLRRISQKQEHSIKEFAQAIQDVVKHHHISDETKFMRILSLSEYTRKKEIKDSLEAIRDIKKYVEQCARDRDLLLMAVVDISKTVTGSHHCHDKVAHVKALCRRALNVVDNV